MASHEFFIALEFSGDDTQVSLVDELAAQILRYVGCSSIAAPDLSAALEQAAVPTGAERRCRCDVQFRVHEDALEILISSNGGRVWQTSLAILDAPAS